MKIHHHLSILTLALATFATSCTDEIKFGNAFIEKTPGGAQTIDTVFANAEYTRQFLTGIYALQYYGLPYSSNRSPVSQFAYSGKLDALTDCYQIHWNGTTIYNSYYSGTLSANDTPLVSYTNDMVWEAVRQAWILIENIDKVEGLSNEEKANMVAQAKCLIAARYFDLYSLYGGLPIVKNSFTGLEGGYELPRASAEATANYMVQLLDEAIPNLRWAYNGTTTDTDAANNTGRWTAAGAMALKAKILMFNASPLYNSDEGYFGGTTQAEKDSIVWHGGYKAERWTRALQACQDFFNRLNSEGYYKLTEPADVNCQKNANGYRQAYRMGYIYQGSKEVLHSTRVATVYGTQGTYSWWNWIGLGRNSYLPTVEYMSMFPWSDGTPFDWEADTKGGRISGANGRLFYQYRNYRGSILKTPSRDPRLYENILVNGTTYTFDWTQGAPTGDCYELWVNGYDEASDVMSAVQNKETGQYEFAMQEKLTSKYSTGMGVIKYYLGEEYHRKYMHWVYLSLDEMYLMYAEALAQTGNLTAAIEQVDIVRARVGLGGLNKKKASFRNINYAENQKELLEEILRERACELGMSNNRYYDMIRYKRTDWITKPLHGLITYRLMENSKGEMVRSYDPWKGTQKDNGVVEPSQFEYELFELFNRTRDQWGKDANSAEIKKWLLFPLPIGEINKGYGLVQNPGW